MMAAPPRYTLVQNQQRQALFEEIWQEYPRLRGDTARTMHLALEMMADSAPRHRPEPDRTGQNRIEHRPAPSLDAQADEPEINDDIFAGVEI
jgi:hypothetical protein